MGRMINTDAAYAVLTDYYHHSTDTQHQALREALGRVESVDAVPVVRCKDCKHRPTGENRDDLEFPDDKCPCKCEDYWYSWKPADEWYCGNGEPKDGEQA